MDKNPTDAGHVTCPHCGTVTDAEAFKKTHRVCEKCGFHTRLNWQERLDCTGDPGSFKELDSGMESKNPIGFPTTRAKSAPCRKAAIPRKRWLPERELYTAARR